MYKRILREEEISRNNYYIDDRLLCSLKWKIFNVMKMYFTSSNGKHVITPFTGINLLIENLVSMAGNLQKLLFLAIFPPLSLPSSQNL